MADGSAAASKHPLQFRSISMPPRPHPAILRVEEELKKLRNCVALSSSMPQVASDGLRELAAAYKSIEKHLCFPCNQKAFTCSLQKNWLEDELDESIRLLDLCGDLKDSFTTMKEHVQDLQALIRRGENAAIEGKVSAYFHIANKANKDVKNCFKSLKQMNGKCVGKGCDQSVVSSFLLELKAVTVSLLHLVSSFLSMQTRGAKTSKWSSVTKALNKSKVVSWYSSLEDICCKGVDDSRVVKFQNQLQVLEDNAKVLESGLECLFKQLIKSRVHLLNIISS
ncbi:hypothetical protein Cni_G21952 [Canna indica]|uniref:Uncharacterized protein n=1 Tax=Canna indica TaxID=4628 RepID=A0AAQ3QKS8_9LILI|nr:hypothetical protein Cni_G21952 [Canna indica]